MAETHFVIIHGLASKPSKEVLEKRYRKHLLESVDRDISNDRFHVAYWADLMGYLPPDGPEEDEYSEDRDNFRDYSIWENISFTAIGLLRDRADELIERKLNAVLELPTLQSADIDSFLEVLPDRLAGRPARHLYSRFLPDLHKYFFGDENENVKEKVRDRLREQIASVPSGSDICLIAHSMGSIIALDVLIADQLNIQTLITIGSPLGLSVVQEQIGVDDDAKRRLSTGIARWCNLFDPLDIVAIDNDLNGKFEPMSIEDTSVTNTFVNKDDDRNHHKSYGYLRSPELGNIVRELI